MSTAIENAVILNNVLTPKSSQGVFELPCGYLDPSGALFTDVELSEMTGSEEDMLGSKTVPDFKKMSTLIGRCLRRLGSISDRGRLAALVSDLLVGDRVYLLFALRRVTLGDEYPFSAKCKNLTCAKEGIYTIDLSELTVKKMPEPLKRIYDVTLPSGKAARFHPLDGHGEERLAKLDNHADRLSLSILGRLELLDAKPPTLEDVKALGIRDRNELRDMFEQNEGGVDTETEMTCSFCGEEWKEEVNPFQLGFFSPVSVKRKASKKSVSF